MLEFVYSSVWGAASIEMFKIEVLSFPLQLDVQSLKHLSVFKTGLIISNEYFVNARVIMGA